MRRSLWALMALLAATSCEVVAGTTGTRHLSTREAGALGGSAGTGGALGDASPDGPGGGVAKGGCGPNTGVQCNTGGCGATSGTPCGPQTCTSGNEGLACKNASSQPSICRGGKCECTPGQQDDTACAQAYGNGFCWMCSGICIPRPNGQQDPACMAANGAAKGCCQQGACAPCGTGGSGGGTGGSGGCSCGGTGAPSSSYTCVNGHCLYTLATQQQFPVGIAVDTSNVYWADSGSGGSAGVQSRPKTGGSTTWLAEGLSNPWGIAVGQSKVYITEKTPNGSVLAVDKSGGGTTAIATNQNMPTGIAVYGGNIFWTTNGGTIMEYAGGTQKTLASNQATPMGITVDGTNVYWVNEGDGKVMKVPITNGSPSQITSISGSPVDIAVNSKFAYVVDNNGAFFDAPLGGGAPAKLATGVAAPWSSVAIDSSTAYIAATGGAEVFSVPLAGGNMTVLATNQVKPTGIAQDASAIYWTDNGNGRIMEELK